MSLLRRQPREIYRVLSPEDLFGAGAEAEGLDIDAGSGAVRSDAGWEAFARGAAEPELPGPGPDRQGGESVGVRAADTPAAPLLDDPDPRGARRGVPRDLRLPTDLSGLDDPRGLDGVGDLDGLRALDGVGDLDGLGALDGVGDLDGLGALDGVGDLDGLRALDVLGDLDDLAAMADLRGGDLPGSDGVRGNAPNA